MMERVFTRGLIVVLLWMLGISVVMHGVASAIKLIVWMST